MVSWDGGFVFGISIQLPYLDLRIIGRILQNVLVGHVIYYFPAEATFRHRSGNPTLLNIVTSWLSIKRDKLATPLQKSPS